MMMKEELCSNYENRILTNLVLQENNEKHKLKERTSESNFTVDVNKTCIKKYFLHYANQRPKTF